MASSCHGEAARWSTLGETVSAAGRDRRHADQQPAVGIALEKHHGRASPPPLIGSSRNHGDKIVDRQDRLVAISWLLLRLTDSPSELWRVCLSLPSRLALRRLPADVHHTGRD